MIITKAILFTEEGDKITIKEVKGEITMKVLQRGKVESIEISLKTSAKSSIDYDYKKNPLEEWYRKLRLNGFIKSKEVKSEI